MTAPAPDVSPLRSPGGAAVEQLRALAQGECPEEALEAALRVVIGVAGAGAGALCLFDARHETLRLAAEQGLSDAGCKMLRSIRRGDSECWDMPLRSLLNNRAYLIENTRKGRYVPFLVDGPPHTTVVACIPLYAESFPLGSLLLLALEPDTLKHAGVQDLAAPLRELASLVQALRRRGNGGEAERPKSSAPDPPSHPAAASPPTDEPDVGKLREALAAAEATANAREAERRRLEDELAATRAQMEEARQRADQLLAVVEALRRQYDATQLPGLSRSAPGEDAAPALAFDSAASGSGAPRHHEPEPPGTDPDPGAEDPAALHNGNAVPVTPAPPPSHEEASDPTASSDQVPAGSDAAPAPPANPSAADNACEWDALVLDQGEGWLTECPEGSRVLALHPERAAEDLRSHSAPRVIVNLAATGSLEALGRLARTGIQDEAWGCITRDDGEHLLHVGRLKPVCYPVDPEAVAGSFERAELNGTRVLAVATDVDTVLALRKALSDRGASVSIAWSAKQAVDLVPMLRPQIAVVDLGLALREGTDVVVQLARSERPPIFVFLPAQADVSRAFTVQLGLPANAEVLTSRRHWLARILRGEGNS